MTTASATCKTNKADIMEKTIEKAYFKAFQQLADDCISYILQKGLKQIQPPELRAVCEIPLLLHCSSIEELQKAIPNDFEQFQRANKQSEISKEIESNIDSITDPKERLKYLFSLLTPFKEICRAIHPKEHKPKEKAERSVNSWERLERSRQGFFDGNNDLKYSVLSRIAERNKYYELSYILPSCYRQIKKGTIEYYLQALLLNMENYSNRLYAVLIQRGIDLKDIQEKAGIYLKGNWVADDIAPYIGGLELAQYYIDSIKHDEQQPIDEQPKTNDGQIVCSHFNAPYTTDQLTTIFESLIDGDYLHPDSHLKDWLIVCGADTSNEPTKPLKWQKETGLLGWLVYSMFPNDKTNYWEITAKCFTVKGKAPNINTMKNAVSRVSGNYKDKPKNFEELERLLKV